MKISPVFGGRSSEHDASLASFRNVLPALVGEVDLAAGIYIDRTGRFHLDESPSTRDEVELCELPVIGPIEAADALGESWALNLLHGQEGEDGVYAGWARVHGLRGSWGTVIGDAVGMAKWVSGPVAAAIMGSRGRSPRTFTLRLGSETNLPRDIPLIIKPGSSGASIKTYAVDRWSASCTPLIDNILATTPTALVQERVFGTEYSVGVLEICGRPLALPVVRIDSAVAFYDHAAKHQGGHATKHFEDSPTSRLLQDIAVELFTGMECFGMARMDFIVPDDGVPVYLETNTLPGLMAASLFPAMLNRAGMTITDLVKALHAADCARHERELDVGYRYTIEESH